MGKFADFISSQSIVLSQGKQREMLNLDREFVELEAEVQVLRTQKRNLEAQVHPLEKKVERLEERIKEKAAQGFTPLDIQEQMLRVLNHHPNSPTEMMATSHDMTPEAAKFHLDTMKKNKLVDWDYDGNGNQCWRLEHDGRAYLHKKGWLK